MTLSQPKSQIHVKEEDFEISSDVPKEDILTTKLLDKVLPGRTGTYLLPHDAVIRMTKTDTTINNVYGLFEKEQTSQTARSIQINHLDVATQPTEQPMDEDDDEEDLYSEPESDNLSGNDTVGELESDDDEQNQNVKILTKSIEHDKSIHHKIWNR